MGEVGCVNWMFKKSGQIFIPAAGADEDALMEAALEAGAEDIKNEGEMFVVLTDWQDMMNVRETLEQNGVPIDSAEVTMIPDNTVAVEGKNAESLLKLISALEDSDDVSSVSANYEIDDALMEQLMA